MIIVGLGACASTESCAKKPTFEIHHAQILGVTMNGLMPGILVGVVVKVNNTNSFDIQVRNLYAQTTLAGIHQLPPISIQPNLWLRAKQTTQMTIPVNVPLSMIPGILASTLGTEDITYSVQGYADVTATQSVGIRLNNEPVNDSGVVKRSALLSAARPAMPGLN